MSDLPDRPTMVVGAGGLGRGIAAAFARAGAPVVAVARSTADLAAAEPGVTAEAADAADPATQRFLAAYATDEAHRAGLDLTVTAVLPRMTPHGAVGRAGIRAYTTRTAQTEEAYIAQLAPLLTPEIAGKALLDLVRTDATSLAAAYLLGGDGLQALG